MARWYSTLFLTRNSTVLTNESIDLILFPWTQCERVPIPQYYGLGAELIILTAPEIYPVSFTMPDAVYYMGGSECTFFSIAIWYSSTNPFNTSQVLDNVPLLSIAARNNRILNVTLPIWY